MVFIVMSNTMPANCPITATTAPAALAIPCITRPTAAPIGPRLPMACPAAPIASVILVTTPTVRLIIDLRKFPATVNPLLPAMISLVPCSRAAPTPLVSSNAVPVATLVKFINDALPLVYKVSLSIDRFFSVISCR